MNPVKVERNVIASAAICFALSFLFTYSFTASAEPLCVDSESFKKGSTAGITYVADLALVPCSTVPDPDPDPDPEPEPPASPELTVAPLSLPADGGTVSLSWDTGSPDRICKGYAPGIEGGEDLAGVGNFSVVVRETSEFVLDCNDGSEPARATVLVSDSPPPPPTDTDGDGIPDADDACPTDPTNTCDDPPPPPVDSDGDGIPDDLDACPNDPTNTCDDPVEPPQVGDMRGIPAKPGWAYNVGTPARYTGGDIVLVGSPTELATVSCFGDSVTLPGEQSTISGSYYAIMDCTFPGGRLKIGGDHGLVSDIHTRDVDKAGFAIGGKDIYVENSSARNHRHSNQDRHGFQVACGSSDVTIVDSESSLNSGDGFQAGHGCSGARVKNVFIGGFSCNANRENCVDFKYVDGVVASNITSVGHGDAAAGGFESGSDGSSVIFGSDGDSLNAWLIDSTLDDKIGIRVEDGNGGVVLGNRFLSDYAIAMQKHGDPMDVRNNWHRGSLFMGRPDRAQNFCMNVQGNDYTGSVNAQFKAQAKCYVEGLSIDISDLEARFEARFKFPLAN